MAYVSFLLFARFMAIIDVAWTAPYPRRASMPCSADVQISHDDCAPEMCRRQSALSIPHEHLWLARVLPCLVFLYITIVVLALLVIARACYGAASSHREEDESPSSRSPLMGRSRASSTTLYSSSPHQPSVACPTPSHQQSFQASETGINSFAPSFVDSPKRQGTLQSLDGPNFEQGSDNRRTSAITQPTDLEVVIHSRSTTVDDQTSTTFYHSTKLRYETQPENCIPTESGRAQSALRTQLEAGRRAETAPNFIIRSASSQLTLLKSLIRRASMQPLQRADVRILGVGLGWDHDEDMALPGPAHDIQWLKTLFENHQYVRFSYLLHNDATYEGIRQRLEETYESATVDTYLIVYYTGHGTENNSLRLYDPSSEPINEVVMNKWIVELRRKTGKHIPVYVVFDFCRASPVEPNTNLDRDIHIIWACSPLQDALDLDWGSEGEFEQDLPRSCFLMALILAVHDTSTNPAFPSWRKFATRLKELVNVVRGGEYWQSKDRLPWLRCRCRACLGGDICANARNSEERHLFQVVSLSTLEENPDFAAVARFVASHFPLRIQRVVRHVSNNHWVMFFNPVRITANRGSLQSRQLEFLRSNISVSTQITVRHMTVPIGLSNV